MPATTTLPETASEVTFQATELSSVATGTSGVPLARSKTRTLPAPV
ncbi:MAG: hypothetical protein ACK55I_22015 [bacterium]